MNNYQRPLGLLLFGGVLLLFLFSCQHVPTISLDEQLNGALADLAPTGNKSYFIFPASDDYAAIPNQDPNNPITAEKVQLGKLLYFETGFAQKSMHYQAMETYSCASCHVPDKGFTPGRLQGVADGGIGFGETGEGRIQWNIFDEDDVDVQGLRALSMLNLAYVTNTFWSGQFGANDKNVGTENRWDAKEEFKINHLGYYGQESQHIVGIDLHRLEVNEKLLDEYGYRAYFDAAFPDVAVSKRYTNETASFALSAYLRTLFASKAPFQKWLKGDANAMTTNQKRGALVFLKKAGCTGCHYSPSFNSMEFHRLGTKDMYNHADAIRTSESDDKNLGRGGFTGKAEDMRAFKVPQLYNVGDYATYFHGSSKTSLRELLNYKINAKSENRYVLNSSLSEKFNPISLTEVEKDQILDFLANGLRDPDLERYVPKELPSGNCFPNNDPFSQVDLGCD
ncbi:MAG TPA: hypothetical protein ENK85_04525 [Saprospiraceae bacterium]|nr:hypothetical protein [Saprospiraceae bacterium]